MSSVQSAAVWFWASGISSVNAHGPAGGPRVRSRSAAAAWRPSGSPPRGSASPLRTPSSPPPASLSGSPVARCPRSHAAPPGASARRRAAAGLRCRDGRTREPDTPRGVVGGPRRLAAPLDPAARRRGAAGALALGRRHRGRRRGGRRRRPRPRRAGDRRGEAGGRDRGGPPGGGEAAGQGGVPAPRPARDRRPPRLRAARAPGRRRRRRRRARPPALGRARGEADPRRALRRGRSASPAAGCATSASRCEIENRSYPPIRIGVPFVAVVAADRRSVAWCKVNLLAGEGAAFAQVHVPLPKPCAR